MTTTQVQDRIAEEAARDAFKREIAESTPVVTTAPVEKIVLVDDQGRPTKEGWRKIGELFRKELPFKEREGRGGKRFKYITARQVMDRFDAVVGPGNWTDSFRVLDLEASVVECTVTVFGVSKSDVGFPNNPEHPEDEALKSAYSDALKRAAVHHGVGRFLYGDSV